MAPGLVRSSWLARFLHKAQAEREKEIASRLRMALEQLGTQQGGGPARAFNRISGMLEDPVGSPCYEALWKAFTNPTLSAEIEPCHFVTLAASSTLNRLDVMTLLGRLPH